MTCPVALLVFSDLDGTLLDHETYDWTPAAPALARLRAVGAGLVLASSKTAAEMAPLRAAMGFADWPAIVENGCGLLGPEMGTEMAVNADEGTYRQLRAALRTLPPGFRGFGDMHPDEITRHTGLDPDAAFRARARQFSEPGLWTGPADALPAFERAAVQAGLVVQRGGRFLTLSFGGTKADRMEQLVAQFAPGRTLALGDAPNDIDMLCCADYAIIVANSASPELPRLPGEQAGRISRTSAEGPRGWCAAVTALLDLFHPEERAAPDG